MKNLNRVMLIGNVGSDPVMKRFDNGKVVTTFSLATSDYGGKNDKGESVFKTNWTEIEVWGKTAEVVGMYWKKGIRVYVEGKLKKKSYSDNDGNSRSKTTVVMTEFVYRSKKAEGSVDHAQDLNTETGDDDLPF